MILLQIYSKIPTPSFSLVHMVEDINSICLPFPVGSFLFSFFFLSMFLSEAHDDKSSYPLSPFLKGMKGSSDEKRGELSLPIPVVSI